MGIHQKWTIQMKNSILGMMPPTEDPIDPSVFYVTDGLFSTYSSMRFRQLSIETGKELANVLTRNVVRCIHFERDLIYAFSDKRILKLQRDGLTVLETYREKVPNYADHIGFAGADTFLIGNGNADFLTLFDARTKETRRKKIGGCCGIFPLSQDYFLVFNHHSILSYLPGENKLCKLTDTAPYTKCALGTSGRVYLLCGGISHSGPQITSAAYQIMVYSVLPEASLETTISIPSEICGGLCHAMQFRLSKDESRLFLYDSKTIWVYSILKNRILFRYSFPQGDGMEGIQSVFADQSFLIRTCKSQTGWEVSGWEIHI